LTEDGSRIGYCKACIALLVLSLIFDPVGVVIVAILGGGICQHLYPQVGLRKKIGQLNPPRRCCH